MKTIYISGAITNNPNYKEQFAKAEATFKKAGIEVINPAKNSGNTYKDYIDKGMNQLMECDAIYMLAGYENSTGAMLELTYAKAIGIEIIYDPEATPIEEKESIVSVKVETKNAIEISVYEYVRLKDFETRFLLLRKNMLHAEYCSLQNQFILGIENEYAKRSKEHLENFIQMIPPLGKGKELNADLFPAKK